MNRFLVVGTAVIGLAACSHNEPAPVVTPAPAPAPVIWHDNPLLGVVPEEHSTKHRHHVVRHHDSHPAPVVVQKPVETAPDHKMTWREKWHRKFHKHD